MINTDSVLSSSMSLEEHQKLNKKIYFLIKGSDIAYVGQSSEPGSRFTEHRYNQKDFDSVAVFSVSDVRLISEIEADLIVRFKPHLNIRIHANDWIIKSKENGDRTCFSRVIKKRRFCRDRMANIYTDEEVSYRYRVSPCEYTLYDKDGKAYLVNPNMVMEKANANSPQE